MSPRLQQFLTGLTLATLTVVTYAEVKQNDFVNFDDDLYITENQQVKDGLSWQGLYWAWTTFHAANWHPLTWMSLQLDASVYREWAGGYHLTSLFWHTANVVFLFAVFSRMTGALWRSAALAALFAIHPQHVESVAWITERKDVLSAFFGILTLGAYVGYAERPSAWRYMAVALFLTLGLLAKPMLVTLPCVFLLLDYWPLGRLRIGTPPVSVGDPSGFQPAGARWLLLEKLPLFALALASSVVTVFAQRHGEAFSTLERLPIPNRMANAVMSLLMYIVQTFWPTRLAPYYPHPQGMPPAWQVIGAVLLLGGVTALAISQLRRRPYLLVGWLWFVGMLVPVIGLIQVGGQARADRYMYLPHVGLFLMIVWGTADLLRRLGSAAVLGGGLVAASVAALSVITVSQVKHWRSSESLWRYTLEVTNDNAAAHNNLGMWYAFRAQDYQQKGDAEQADLDFQVAVEHLGRAAEIMPGAAQPHYALAEIYFEKKHFDRAMHHYRITLQANPRQENAPRAHLKLGLLLLNRGNLDDARAHLYRAVELDPGLSEGYRGLREIALRQGRLEEAARIGEQLGVIGDEAARTGPAGPAPQAGTTIR